MNGVESDQTGTMFPVTFCQVVPDDDHGNAAGQADRDETDHVIMLSDRNVTASPNIRTGPIIQFCTRDNIRTLTFLNTSCSFS